jgi:hypothetical protein
MAVATSRGQGAAGPGAGPNGLGLVFVPMPPWFKFRPAPEVQKWIDEVDSRAITEHAWDLWGGLTTLTTQKVDGQDVTYPIFETWIDEGTVFAPPEPAQPQAQPRARARRFTLPRQLLHGPVARVRGFTEATPPGPESLRLVTVKYTQEIYDHVQTNQYYATNVMYALNQSWDTTNPPTPIQNRNVKPFPDKSIMIKPVYQVVSGTAASLVPYWAGPVNSTNPSAPGVSTWTKKMLVVPPGIVAPPNPGVPIVPIDRFYNFKLDAQEVAYINAQGQGTYKVGDYAILAGMHVSSREIDDWTWQTFWWSFDKPKIPASFYERVKPPFDNYTVAVGYSFTTGPDNPAGLNVVCYNPYLEAGFTNQTFVKPGQLGIESNCMSCHRTATWPVPANGNYIANGLIDPGDPFFFQGSTKVDFIWGFAFDVAPPGQPAAGVQTPAPVPAATPQR